VARSSDSARSFAFRSLLLSGAGLLLVSAIIAWPAFTRGQSIPFASPAFEAQWNTGEAAIPNFWGPALQPLMVEQYKESPGGTRTVQYFDKARMEQTQPGGPVTNGLLTAELISGKRQFGDATFTPFPPSQQAVVGDAGGTWPTYAALNDTVFPNKVPQNKAPVGTVYQPGGTFTTNAEQAAYPGAAFGSYETDPNGRYGHNVPAAFAAFLQKLPGQWQTAMGYPMTEAFWVNVPVKGNLTWVLVQAFERRVLSYTPSNPAAFQVEMGNIGAHYYQWRYVTNPGDVNGPPTPTLAPTSTSGVCVTPAPPSPTVIRTGTVMIAIPSVSGLPTCVPLPTCDISTATPASTPTGTVVGTATFAPAPTACVTATPDTTATAFATQGTEIRNFRATVTDTTFTLNFSTNYPATSYIRYGTSPGSYSASKDISATKTTSHSLTLTGLTPDTVYYFIIRVDSSVDGFVKPEDYFVTNPVAGTATPTPILSPTAGRPSLPTIGATVSVIPSRPGCLPGQVCDPTAYAKTSVALTATTTSKTAAASTP
jgi:hypothetical protein